MKPARNIQQAPAKIVPILLAGFLGYIDRALRGNFHTVRIAQGGQAPPVSKTTPLVVYLNHASWWDPLVMMWLGARCYPGRPQFGPIDGAQLERYGFFKYLGVFGVEKGTVSGARTFLRTSRALLAQPGAMLWLTPQGRFVDVRERPVNFASGLAHLAMREPDAVFVPLAIEYGFGQERCPEIVLRFGPAQDGTTLGATPAEVQSTLEAALQSTQDALAAAACSREAILFETLLDGRGGVSVPYDLWRRFKAMWNRQKPALNHAPSP